MKKIKRISAFVLTLVMLFSMSLSAFADETTTYELFVKNEAPNHVYDAYQIFAGDLSADGTTLSNITWGASIKDAEALITALTTDTKEIVTTGGTTTLKDLFVSLTTDTNKALSIDKKAALVAEILGTVSNDSTTLDRFAELVGEVNYDASGQFESHKYLDVAVSSATGQTTESGVTGYKISNLPAGYYLIKDKDNVLDDGQNDNQGDFYTKYIVRVVKSASIVAKGEGVKVTKSVNDTVGGTFTEYEDANTNDTIYYKWEGTLPNNLGSYDTYHYKFTDEMSSGLNFKQFEQIYIENADGSVAHTFYNIADQSEENDILPEGILQTVPSERNGDGKYIFSLEFQDLLKSYPSILPSQKVIVKYSAYLTRDALINNSNSNEVTLEYDNNPNGEGTGKTVPDEAHAFTFKIDIDKYDAANFDTKLEGVEFILYKTTTVEENTTYYYAQVVTEEMVSAGTEINGTVVKSENVGLVYGYTTNRGEASILDTDANGAIALKGLDQGIYYLEETKTKDGYNKLDTPVQIEITPTYTSNGEEYEVVVDYEVDGMEQGANHSVGVRNSKGSTLPSTGGIGTTIFYVAGGILVVGAVVILVTKKRMSNEK